MKIEFGPNFLDEMSIFNILALEKQQNFGSN